jgi:AcrR family transcriptional regulator
MHPAKAMNTSTGMSSHDRILFSGKTLFAQNGYESTSTVAIARQAGTSESQLMKHFGSKQGLLSAIFELGWSNILHRARAVSSNGESSPHLLLEILLSLVAELDRDPELKTLLMLESRRVRKDNPEMSVSTGSVQFGTLLENVLSGLKKEGSLRPDLNIRATRAALYGMVEGIMVDQLADGRNGENGSYGTNQAREVLETMVSALSAEPAASKS